MTARHQIDLQISLFRGVAEDIDIPLLAKDPVGLIMPGDEILGCLEFDTEGTIATMADVTANVSISRAGYITNDTAPTSDIWRGMLFWYRNQGNGAHVLSNPCLKQMLVTGGGAAADLTATGLAVPDHIIAVFHLTTAAEISSIEDVTHLCTHTTDAILNCSIATTSDHLWVWYHDASDTAIPNPNYQFLVCDGAAADLTATGLVTAEDTIVTGTHITTKAAVASLSNTVTYSHDTDDEIIVSADTSNDQHLIIWHNAVA
jgi:hypothetical protein